MTLVLLAVAAFLVGLLCAWAGWRGVSSPDLQGSQASSATLTLFALGLFLTVDGVVGLAWLALG